MRRALIVFAFVAAVAGALLVSCESGGGVPAWDEATKASCWDGPNAESRTMNVLSPLMDDATFKERLRFMKGRGANTAHVLLVNQRNGECAGYSPWGIGVGPSAAPCDEQTVRFMRHRICVLRDHGLAVVVWVMSDDSRPWARALADNADACLARLSEAGLLDDASTVVAGLEMDEYWGAAEAARVVSAIRSVYGGKVGVHHTDGKAPFAAMGDILFYQTAPGKSAAQIAAETRTALAHGRPVNVFELDRHANRPLCEAALSAGAFGVGNW